MGIVDSIEAGSYRAAGGTSAVDTNFSGTVLDLGSSLDVTGSVSFAPATGGPVTLTTGAMTIQAPSAAPTASLPTGCSP